ncbi:SRPBCC family protein [Microlunatus soli]|uniref:Polyketide cyclase / dehydrase and lipid transport n=1 Tax=Microlunatus soli TaxID=630515 RepID=A0A1H1ZUS5_9ACTN|nr:SRPBCC family protein [Microlunatus soli]SDT37440.1 Polyketide cyclase / dehydrase and lipid transport [Microlunatus soli]
MNTESFSRSRHIAASADQIFALLSNPARHRETEPDDWVRDAIDTEPITEVGQIFGMNMYAEGAGGAYVIHNRVTVLEPGRSIGWEPGQYNDAGELECGGWRWRYDVADAADGGAEVTLHYDWSRVPEPVREYFGGMPIFGPEFLDKSLETLDRTISGVQEGVAAR